MKKQTHRFKIDFLVPRSLTPEEAEKARILAKRLEVFLKEAYAAEIGLITAQVSTVDEKGTPRSGTLGEGFANMDTESDGLTSGAIATMHSMHIESVSQVASNCASQAVSVLTAGVGRTETDLDPNELFDPDGAANDE